MKFKTLPSLIFSLILPVVLLAAESSDNENGDATWEKVNDLLAKPSELFSQKKPSSKEEYEVLKKELGQLALSAADAAHQFSLDFPKSRHFHEARMAELEMLATIVRFARTDSGVKRLLVMEDAILADEKAPSDQKYMIEMRRAMEAVEKEVKEGSDELASTEKQMKSIFERYPDRPDTWGVLLAAASDAPREQALPVVKRILASAAATEDIKATGRGLLARLEAVGLPMDLHFTAVDGRKVDLASLKGKVVLVDFWATWCGPCVKELPRLLKLYSANKDKGLEIIGISLDEDQSALEEFVKQKKIPWPQAFDGKGWQGDYAARFGISSIPQMWLVDKKGLVRTTEGRKELETEIPKLLAE